MHVDSIEWLSGKSELDLMRLTNLNLRVLRAQIKPDGFNVGAHPGRVSRAGVEGHGHLHIVPRWDGDTNFMPLFSQTRVMPEHLDVTYRKLNAGFMAALTGRSEYWSISRRRTGTHRS